MGQFVKYYSSFETGAPVLNNVAGAAVNVFDAVLVNGFNARSVSALIVSGNVATATIATHGYNTYSSTMDMDITIEGATPAGLNGSKMVTIIDANTVTFAAPGIPDGAASGTITSKRSSLGWTKPFSGTSKGMYRPTDVAASGMILRVDDTGGSIRDFRVMGVESATGIDTYTNQFPTNTQIPGGLYWTKGELTSRAKNWMIIGDSRLFYMLVESTGYATAAIQQNRFCLYAFGDFNSIRPADPYGCIISGGHTATSASGTTNVLPRHSTISTFTDGATYTSFAARDYTSLVSPGKLNISLPYGEPGSSAKVFPNPINNGIVIVDGCVLIEQNASLSHPIRGFLPGVAGALVATANLPEMPIFDIRETTFPVRKYAIINTITVGTSSSITFGLRLDANWRS
jgi:hypothetical protein